MLARSTLTPWRTARRNVELGLELRGVPRKERSARAVALLERVNLAPFADAYPSQLSHGMRQRVAIARTFAIDPDLWLMDEPFGALDAQTRLLVQMQFLELWAETGKTVILVTHDLEEAVLLADRVIVIGARPGCVKSDTLVDGFLARVTSTSCASTSASPTSSTRYGRSFVISSFDQPVKEIDRHLEAMLEHEMHEPVATGHGRPGPLRRLHVAARAEQLATQLSGGSTRRCSSAGSGS